jgi:hypothetical protein
MNTTPETVLIPMGSRRFARWLVNNHHANFSGQPGLLEVPMYVVKGLLSAWRGAPMRLDLLVDVPAGRREPATETTPDVNRADWFEDLHGQSHP